MYRLSALTSAFSGDWPKKYSGCCTMYWSSAPEEATRIVAAAVRRLPARPASCQVLATVPG